MKEILILSIDKKSYLTGEKVKALFKTPFSGKMLVTMETDHVVSHQYVDVDNRSASLDLKLSGEHVPNVYITATLIKPHEVSDIPLTVAHGFQNVTVEEKEPEDYCRNCSTENSSFQNTSESNSKSCSG